MLVGRRVPCCSGARRGGLPRRRCCYRIGPLGLPGRVSKASLLLGAMGAEAHPRSPGPWGVGAPELVPFQPVGSTVLSWGTGQQGVRAKTSQVAGETFLQRGLFREPRACPRQDRRRKRENVPICCPAHMCRVRAGSRCGPKVPASAELPDPRGPQMPPGSSGHALGVRGTHGPHLSPPSTQHAEVQGAEETGVTSMAHASTKPAGHSEALASTWMPLPPRGEPGRVCWPCGRHRPLLGPPSPLSLSLPLPGPAPCCLPLGSSLWSPSHTWLPFSPQWGPDREAAPLKSSHSSGSVSDPRDPAHGLHGRTTPCGSQRDAALSFALSLDHGLPPLGVGEGDPPGPASADFPDAQP